ncbi:MAG: zinc dependent phospholipase C family protein [Atopobiaceae bacterium]
MPAILTHDFFGQDAYGEALQTVRLFTPDERDAFLLGNQGPDPLFYLAAAPHRMDPFKSLGDHLHHDEPSHVLYDLRRAVDQLDPQDQSVAGAYVAGFLCHYLLDSTMHPLVYFWQNGLCGAGVERLDTSDGGVVHAEVERDLDEMVLYAKTHQTVATYRPYERVLQARDRVLNVLGQLYAQAFTYRMTTNVTVANDVFPCAVRDFRIVQRVFFYSPTGGKTRALSVLEKPILRKRYSLCRAMTHRDRAEDTSDFDNRHHLPWKNPFTGAVSTDSFWDLYQGAQKRVGEELPRLMSADVTLDEVKKITGGLNFSGDPVQED